MLYPKAKINYETSMHYVGGKNRTVNRSMISKEYARRFILENILGEYIGIEKKRLNNVQTKLF